MLTFLEMMGIPLDLHHAVRKTDRQAIAERRGQREAFDLALNLVLERQPQARPPARRAVAIMLVYKPDFLPGTSSASAAGQASQTPRRQWVARITAGEGRAIRGSAA
jgi:hypothetical protein